jgi:hypothetical protein
MTMQKAERELTNMKFSSMTEYKILKHWRLHEPKLVEELLDKQMLNKALEQKAEDLLDLQIQLEKTEKLDPALSRLEAWNRLMKSSTPDEDEPASYAEMDL